MLVGMPSGAHRTARALGCLALSALGACSLTSLDGYFACPTDNPHCKDQPLKDAGAGVGGTSAGAPSGGGGVGAAEGGTESAGRGGATAGTGNEAGATGEAGAGGAPCTTSADCGSETCSRGFCGPAFTLTYLDTPDKGTDETAAKWIKFTVQINNRTGASVSLSDFTIRYYFTPEGNAMCCMSQVLSTMPPPSDVSDVSGGFEMTANGWDYLETSFDSSAGKIGSDASSGQVQMGIHNNSFSSELNNKNDYSWNTMGDASHITLYRAGVLIWGIEPATGPIH